MTGTGKPSSSADHSADIGGDAEQRSPDQAPATSPSSPDTGVDIEPRTMSLRMSSPGRATPTAHLRRSAEVWISGPSNQVLAALWLVAALSIAVAAYLYLR
jgi:hypothetical protein